MNRSREDATRNVITLASCEDGNWPQIDQLNDGDFEIQGYTIATADKPDMPAGHDRVRIPRDTLLSLVTATESLGAARRLRQPSGGRRSSVTPDEFNAAFDEFRSSAFRLECLQTYAVGAEDARLRAFRAGLPRPERSVRTSPWLQRIAATTMAGKSWARVRLVRHPLTEYTRYELIGLVESQAAGDQIRVVNLDGHPELGGLGPDFWLFDAGEPDEFAIIMRYDTGGAVLGYERTTEVGWCREQHDAAIAASISLAEYLVQPR